MHKVIPREFYASTPGKTLAPGQAPSWPARPSRYWPDRAKYGPDIMRTGILTFAEIRARFVDLYARDAPVHFPGCRLPTIHESGEERTTTAGPASVCTRRTTAPGL